VCESFQYRTIGSIQKNRSGIEIRTANLISNLIPIQKLCKIFEIPTDSKKIKQNPNLKKKNKAQESSNTPVRYFNRRERLPIFFNKLFM
tara:strand:+ start:5470 stop:5736 length:267 start_codon:yes stop_codon:yes gene_type:complete